MLSRRRLKNLSPIQNTLKFFTPMSNCHSRRFVWIYLLRIIKEKAQAMTKQKNKNLGSHLAQVVVGAGLAIGGGAVGASAHTTHSPMNPAAVNPAAIAKPGSSRRAQCSWRPAMHAGQKRPPAIPVGRRQRPVGPVGPVIPALRRKAVRRAIRLPLKTPAVPQNRRVIPANVRAI